jgi:hypothetical protein
MATRRIARRLLGVASNPATVIRAGESFTALKHASSARRSASVRSSPHRPAPAAAYGYLRSQSDLGLKGIVENRSGLHACTARDQPRRRFLFSCDVELACAALSCQQPALSPDSIPVVRRALHVCECRVERADVSAPFGLGA